MYAFQEDQHQVQILRTNFGNPFLSSIQAFQALTGPEELWHEDKRKC